MKNRACFHIFIALLTSLGQTGCRSSINDQLQMSLQVSSPSFGQGGEIPREFTCDGANSSPALSWQSPPAQTQSMALIVSDEDSPFGFNFKHWTLYNLPPSSQGVAASEAKQGHLADGSEQGLNDNQAIGYMGPCPPGTSTHRYLFTVYALDTKLDLSAGVKEKEIEKAMQGHILAAGQLMGRYHR